MKLNLLGLFYEHSGYGKMAREYAYALYRQGIDVAAISLTNSKIKDLGLRDEDYYVLKEIATFELHNAIAATIYTPENYHPTLSPIYNIGYCELESDRLPQAWVENCNLMQEIWVPTEFFRKAALESGVKARIEVIPQGIDTGVFKPDVEPFPLKLNQRFKFFMNGEFIPRKNFKMALEAFWDTFTSKDDVCMVLKTYDLSDPDFEINIPKKIAEWKKGFKNPAPVYLLNAFVKDRDLPRLYAAIDCLVHPAAGEGWGFPPLEALACEKPVIYTKWGAMGEIILPSFGYQLNYKLVDIPKFGIPNDKLFAGAKWAEPNRDELCSYMSFIYNRHDTAKQKAKTAREHFIEDLSWDKAARKISARLKHIEQQKKIYASADIPVPVPLGRGLKRRVNMVCPSFGKRCGIATYTEKLLAGFAGANGSSLEIVTNENETKGYGIIHLQFQYGLYSILSLEEILRSSRAAGREAIVTMHDYGESAIEHNKLIRRYANTIVVHSAHQEEALVANGFNGAKICVIPHGIDTQTYLKNKEKAIKPEKNLVGYFGFAYDHKGLIELGMATKGLGGGIRAKVLCSIGVNSKVSFQYWEKVRKFFNRRNIWPHIDLRTRYLSREELAEELSECELIVLPYMDYGNVGVSGAVREAMLAGRPILVTDTPFFKDLADGQEVFKIKDNWPETIQEGILNFLGRKTPACMDDRIKADSWESVAEKHRKLYLREGI